MKIRRWIALLTALIMMISVCLPAHAAGQCIDEEGHNWVYSGETSSTCIKHGIKELKCTKCGFVQYEELPLAPHTWTSWDVVVPATCTKTGERVRYCAVCDVDQFGEIPKTDHSYGSWKVTKEATCVSTGTRTRKCSNCGKTQEESISKTSHKYGDWTVTTYATDHSAGVKTRTCTVCGHSEKKNYDPDGTLRRGDKGDAVKQMQQCLIDAGYLAPGGADGDFGPGTEKSVAAFQADQGFAADGVGWPQTIGALQHEFTPWTTVVEPTDFSVGKEERSCTKCSYKESRTKEPPGILRPGMVNDGVFDLQGKLNEAGYDCGEPDGSYGPMTQNAVTQFEKDNGLTPDGIAWPGVITLLHKNLELPEGNGSLFLMAEQITAEKDAYYEGDMIIIKVTLSNNGGQNVTNLNLYRTGDNNPEPDASEYPVWYSIGGMADGYEESCTEIHFVTKEEAESGLLTFGYYADGIWDDGTDAVSGEVTLTFDTKAGSAPESDGAAISLTVVQTDPPEEEVYGANPDGLIGNMSYDATITNTGSEPLYIRWIRVCNPPVDTVGYMCLDLEEPVLLQPKFSITVLVTAVPEASDMIPGSGTSEYDGIIPEVFVAYGNDAESGIITAVSNEVELLYPVKLDKGEPGGDDGGEITDDGGEGSEDKVKVIKTVSNKPLDEKGFAEGEKIYYTIIVINLTDEPIDDVEITDPLKGNNEDSIVDILVPLEGGAVVTRSFEYTVTAEDAGNDIVNTASAAWIGEDGNPVVVDSNTMVVPTIKSKEETPTPTPTPTPEAPTPTPEPATPTPTPEPVTPTPTPEPATPTPTPEPATPTPTPEPATPTPTPEPALPTPTPEPALPTPTPEPATPTPKPEAPVVNSTDGGSDTCVRKLTGKDTWGSVFELTWCSQHQAIEKQIFKFENYASTDEQYLVIRQMATHLWTDEIVHEYDMISASYPDPADQKITNDDRESFFAWIDALREDLNNRYGDDPLMVEDIIVDILMNHCADLCYLMHMAPEDRPDSVLTGDYEIYPPKETGLSTEDAFVTEPADASNDKGSFMSWLTGLLSSPAAQDAEASDDDMESQGETEIESDEDSTCRREVMETDTGIEYSEIFCGRHIAPVEKADKALASAITREDQMAAFTALRTDWLTAFDELTAEKYNAAGEEEKQTISDERDSFDELVLKREALLTLMYPDKPLIVEEQMGILLKNRLIILCRHQ